MAAEGGGGGKSKPAKIMHNEIKLNVSRMRLFILATYIGLLQSVIGIHNSCGLKS